MHPLKLKQKSRYLLLSTLILAVCSLVGYSSAAQALPPLNSTPTPQTNTQDNSTSCPPSDIVGSTNTCTNTAPTDPCSSTTNSQSGACASNFFSSFISTALVFLSIGVGVVVAIMIVIGGIQYSTSAGNPQAAAAAKKRILNALIAAAAYFLIYALLQWIVPSARF